MMKLIGITFTFNEAEIVPFVMDYWQNLGVDKLIVFDNCSTDSTVEQLSRYSFVEIRQYHTEGTFDEFCLTNLRNCVWKGLDADWVIVTDFDEVPFYAGEGDFKNWLWGLDSTLIHTAQINVVRDTFPSRVKGNLLHYYPGNLFNRQARMDKVHCWKPKDIKEIGYELGCHQAHPEGNVLGLEYPENFYFLHLRYMGKEYVLNKSQGRYDRLTAFTKTTLVNHHYKDTLDNYEGEIKKLGKLTNLKEALRNE